MSTIDFTPTAYTVESPEDGAQVRYEGSHHEGSIKESKRRFLGLAKAYPHLAAKVVPDHFVQEYCAADDSGAWAGRGRVDDDIVLEIFLGLLETAAIQGIF
jgi:hypothetical protein